MKRSLVPVLGPGLGMVLALGGCSRPAVPDPRAAAADYADAAKRGDADAIYAMMTRSSQAAYGEQRTRELVLDTKEELRETGHALGREQVEVEVQAELRFIDGERALFDYEDRQFRIATANTLPAAAQSPEQALEDLRQALTRRSYAALVRTLSDESRANLETGLRGLVEGLERPDTLEIDVEGDRAAVIVPGGHFVRLRRENGIWRVEDFE